MPPVEIDGNPITGATIDGTDVQEITVDGDVVFSAGPVPPSQNLAHRYDAANLTNATTFPDSFGTADLTVKSGSPSIITSGKNGLNILDFDGDSYEGSFAIISQPFHVFSVFKFDAVNTNTNNHIFSGFNNDVRFRNENIGVDSPDYNIFAGQGIDGGSTDTNFHIVATLFDGSNSEIVEDRSLVAFGDPGNNSLDGLTVGGYLGGGFFLDGKICEILVYDTDVSAQESDIFTFLENKWAI